MKFRSRGVVLFETLWILTVFMVLIAAAHVSVVKFWNRRLQALQGERLKYDGEVRWDY